MKADGIVLLTILVIGAWLCGCSASAQAPLPGYTDIYVSSYGSDSNSGLGWGTAKATIGAAVTALPYCATDDVKGTAYALRCGRVHLAAGTLPVYSGVMISSPLVSVIGAGSASSHLAWTGAGCAITADVGLASHDPGLILPGPTFQGFSIDGSGNSNTNSCGLHYTNGSHVTLRDMAISDFTAPSDSCLYGTTGGATGDERAVFEHLYIGNCTVGWALQNTQPTFSTIGYGSFDVYINVEKGQTGIISEGNGEGAELRLFFSVFHVTVNSDDGNSTCATFSNYSLWSDDTGVFRCDGYSNGIQIDSTSHVYFGGDLSSDGGTSVANGGHLVVQDIAQDPITGNDGMIEYEATTSSNTGTGPHWDMQGQYWTGTQSAADTWDFQDVPSQAGSDLVLQHTTGPSVARFVAPTVEILASPNGYGGYSNTLSAPGGGYYHNSLPAANGSLVNQGADGISAGTIAMLSGSGSHTFDTPYTSAPVCTATDTIGGAPVMVTSTTTAVSVTGTGSDMIAWICAPAVN